MAARLAIGLGLTVLTLVFVGRRVWRLYTAAGNTTEVLDVAQLLLTSVKRGAHPEVAPEAQSGSEWRSRAAGGCGTRE